MTLYEGIIQAMLKEQSDDVMEYMMLSNRIGSERILS